MYDVKKTHGKDGNMNTQQYFEKDNLSHKDRTKEVNIGDIVIIKAESKNRSHCKIGKISQLYSGKDVFVKTVQMQVGTNFLA